MLLASVCEANPLKAPPSLQQITMLWKATHWPEGTVHLQLLMNNLKKIYVLQLTTPFL